MYVAIASNAVQWFFFLRFSFISYPADRIINNFLSSSNETRCALGEESGDVNTFKTNLGTGSEIDIECEELTVISDLVSDLSDDADEERRKILDFKDKLNFTINNKHMNIIKIVN